MIQTDAGRIDGAGEDKRLRLKRAIRQLPGHLVRGHDRSID
jgi:hypothetical protein